MDYAWIIHGCAWIMYGLCIYHLSIMISLDLSQHIPSSMVATKLTPYLPERDKNGVYVSSWAVDTAAPGVAKYKFSDCPVHFKSGIMKINPKFHIRERGSFPQIVWHLLKVDIGIYPSIVWHLDVSACSMCVCASGQHKKGDGAVTYFDDDEIYNLIRVHAGF